jgi:hypothetical protein
MDLRLLQSSIHSRELIINDPLIELGNRKIFDHTITENLTLDVFFESLQKFQTLIAKAKHTRVDIDDFMYTLSEIYYFQEYFSLTVNPKLESLKSIVFKQLYEFNTQSLAFDTKTKKDFSNMRYLILHQLSSFRVYIHCHETLDDVGTLIQSWRDLFNTYRDPSSRSYDLTILTYRLIYLFYSYRHLMHDSTKDFIKLDIKYSHLIFDSLFLNRYFYHDPLILQLQSYVNERLKFLLSQITKKSHLDKEVHEYNIEHAILSKIAKNYLSTSRSRKRKVQITLHCRKKR